MWFSTWLTHALDMFRLMAPYLLLGFFLAGVLHTFVPRQWVARHMGGRGLRASFKAALVGTPLPLCSCGVIPFAGLLKRQGASNSAITSFLISTPQTGVDSIMAAYAILGLPLTLWKVLTAMVSGVIGGAVSSLVEPAAPPTGGSGARDEGQTDELADDGSIPTLGASAANAPAARVRAVLSYGLGTLVEDVAFWLVIGTLAGGAIAAFVPDDFLARALPNPYLQIFAVLGVAVPLYVCATGSVPVAAALILKGMPLGAAIVFLIAGPATNIATLSVFARVLGRRGLAVYLGTILVVSLAFGTLFQLLFAGVHLPLSLHAGHDHGAGPALGDVQWWGSAAALLLGVLVLRALLVKARGWVRTRRSGLASIEDPTAMGTAYLKVEGMTCNHCRGSVERAISVVTGVSGVVVSLESGRATVQGDGVSVEALVAAVRDAGYEATPASH